MKTKTTGGCASCEYLGGSMKGKCAVCLIYNLWTDIHGGQRCENYIKFDPYSKRKKIID